MGWFMFDEKKILSDKDIEKFEREVRQDAQINSGFHSSDFYCTNKIRNEEEYNGIYEIFENLDYFDDYRYIPDREEYSDDKEGEKEYLEDCRKYDEVREKYPYLEWFSNTTLYSYNMGRPYIKCSKESREIDKSKYVPFDCNIAMQLIKEYKGQKYIIVESSDKNFDKAVFGDGDLQECVDFCKNNILNGQADRYYIINKSISKYWIIRGSERSKNKTAYHIFGHYHG